MVSNMYSLDIASLLPYFAFFGNNNVIFSNNIIFYIPDRNLLERANRRHPRRYQWNGRLPLLLRTRRPW